MRRSPARRKRCHRCRCSSLVGELVRWCPWCGALNVWWCNPAALGTVIVSRPAWQSPGGHVPVRAANRSTT